MSTRIRSRMPVWDGLTSEQAAYLSDLDRVIPARTDLDVAAVSADIVTALNLLFEDLRVAGIMKRT